MGVRAEVFPAYFFRLIGDECTVSPDNRRSKFVPAYAALNMVFQQVFHGSMDQVSQFTKANVR